MKNHQNSICGCTSTSIEQFFSSGETDFYLCNNCGLVFRYPMPSLVELDCIYAKLYQENMIELKQTNQESNDFAIRQYANYIKKNYLSRESRLLDYGCGSGLLVSYLNSDGYNATGIERSEHARNYALLHRELNILRSMDEIADGSVDLITMIEVIEHLPDPFKEMEHIYEKLSSNGALFITTPNLNGLRARMERGNWREATKKFHVVLFNLSSLQKLLKKSGFKDIKQVRFSPIQSRGVFKRYSHKIIQLMDLSGTLCVVARK
jgi:SAM-dependent methyltransferase